MNINGTLRHFAFRVHISVKGFAGNRTAHHFHPADLNDSMALIEPEPGGFQVKNNLPHNGAEFNAL